MKFNEYKALSALAIEADKIGDPERDYAIDRKKFIDGKIEDLKQYDQEVYVVMYFRYIYGFTVQKIARKLYMSESTVNRKLQKGNAIIKKSLQHDIK